MKNRPLITIITPLYNASSYIEATYKSVVSQTIADFEWIIVNDCSTDNSLELLTDFSKNDNRIKVITQEKNQGPIAARNRAMDEAKGRYIAFIDADDIWLPAKLELQINSMNESGSVLSYTAFKKINKDGSLKNNKLIKVPEKLSFKQLLQSNSIVASSAVYDTDITGSIRQNINAPLGKDDMDFFLNILKKNGKAIGVNKELVHLRVFRESITGNKMKSATNHWYFYRTYLKLSLMESLWNFIVYSIKGLTKYLK